MDTPARPLQPAHLGWRLLALTYDLMPVIAIVFAASALLLLVRGGQPVAAGSVWSYLDALLLWLVCGGYFVLSWQRGGQTLGMRPWRLQVVDRQGRTPPWPVLFGRYSAATLPALLALPLAGLFAGLGRYDPLWIALAVASLGLLWSLIDREACALHDRLSNTRFVRINLPS